MNPTVVLKLLPHPASTSASTSASESTPPKVDITTLVPDKEKLLSDLKAFMSYHEIITAVERKKLKESEKELKEGAVEIEKLNNEVADLKNQVKGAAFLWKENEGLKKFNNDLTDNLQTTAAKNGKLETSLKEKEEKVSRLEQEVEKLEEFKQKVELAQQIFKLPIKNVKINTLQNETHFAICGPLNEKTGATNGAENGAGKSELSTSEKKSSTSSRGAGRAKRGRF